MLLRSYSIGYNIFVHFRLFPLFRSVTAKDVSTGKSTTIYDAKEVLSGLKTPTVKDPKVNYMHAVLFSSEFESSIAFFHIRSPMVSKG